MDGELCRQSEVARLGGFGEEELRCVDVEGLGDRVEGLELRVLELAGFDLRDRGQTDPGHGREVDLVHPEVCAELFDEHTIGCARGVPNGLHVIP